MDLLSGISDEKVGTEGRRPDVRRHFKYVYCRACEKVMCMRVGAVGCYCGRLGIVEVAASHSCELKCRQSKEEQNSMSTAVSEQRRMESENVIVRLQSTKSGVGTPMAK